jgi:hypothetical protein
MKRLAVLAVVACLCGCALAGTGRADSITYTQEATASGSLSSHTFKNAMVTLTFTGDTASVFGNGLGSFFNMGGTAAVSVAGIGSATFTDDIWVADFQSDGSVQFLNNSTT